MIDLNDPYYQQFIEAIASILVEILQSQQEREPWPEDAALQPTQEPDFVVADA